METNYLHNLHSTKSSSLLLHTHIYFSSRLMESSVLKSHLLLRHSSLISPSVSIEQEVVHLSPDMDIAWG